MASEELKKPSLSIIIIKVCRIQKAFDSSDDNLKEIIITQAL
jgi:hypothetical protein